MKSGRSTSKTRAAPSRWDRAARWAGHSVAAAALVVFSVLLVRHRAFFVREIDSQAYYRMAQSYARAEMPVWPDDPLPFNTHPFVDAPGGRVTVKYPPGWPLCLAVGYRLGGVQGAAWVNTVLGIVGAAAFWALAREWFDEITAALATLLWLFSPHLMGYVAYPLAHGASLAFVLTAFYASLRWLRTGRRFWAALGGFSAGFLAVIRPTDMLIWPALGLAMADGWRRIRRDPAARRPTRETSLLYALALLIPLTFYACQNTALFGAPWRTGYAATREQTGFDFSLLRARWPSLIGMRELLLSDSVWLLAGAGLLLAFARRPLLAGCWLLWFLPVAALYGSYYWFAPNLGRAYTRFFLSGLPAAVFCGACVFDVLRSIAWGRLLVLGLVLVWTAILPPREPVALLRHLVPDDAQQMARRLHPHLDGPVDLYSDVQVYAHHAGIYPGVRAVVLRTWSVQHLMNPYAEAVCSRIEPRVELARHARLHAFYRSMGRTGLRAHVLQRLREALAARRRVVLAGPGPTLLSWLGRAPDLVVERIEPDLWEVRRSPDQR